MEFEPVFILILSFIILILLIALGLMCTKVDELKYKNKFELQDLETNLIIHRHALIKLLVEKSIKKFLDMKSIITINEEPISLRNALRNASKSDRFYADEAINIIMAIRSKENEQT